jgi:DNA-binding LacI/PurR family transcriptional regulator
MKKQKNSVSSRDVAKEAGVSQATVSYILNNVQGIKIKPETRQAVMEAIKRLNYHPDEIARGMKLKRSMSVGVVTDRNVTNFYFMNTLQGLRDSLRQANYSITLLLNREDELENTDYISYYNSKRVDGLIFAFASLSDETLVYLNDNGIPYVTIDLQYNGRSTCEVFTDHVNLIDDVIDQFFIMGYKNFGYVGPMPSTGTDRRIERFKAALEKHNLPFNESSIALSTFDDDDIKNSVCSLLSKEDRPEVILSGTPKFGMFAIKYAARLSIKIPNELKVFALGSSNSYNMAEPSLSSIEPPFIEMGKKAGEFLLGIMNGNEAEKAIVLPAKIVHRESG